MHVHLGLYGTFTEVPIPMLLPVGQVRMRMIGAEYGTDLRGPTVCEVISEPEIADIVARLGPDPLRRDADGGLAWARISKSEVLRITIDGPVGDRRGRQCVPQRAAVSTSH